MTHGVFSKFQLSSSNGLEFFQCFEDMEEKDCSNNYKAGCRTAQTTLGLLNMLYRLHLKAPSLQLFEYYLLFTVCCLVFTAY